VLAFSTYLGGNGSADIGIGIAVDDVGNIYVTGQTDSPDFPKRNAISNTLLGGIDVFVTQLIRMNGVYTYGYSTYLGGSGGEAAVDLAVDNTGNVYITGDTISFDFPTWNAISNTFGGGSTDAFVTQIISTSGVYTLGYSTYLGGSGNDYGYGIAVDGLGNTYVAGKTTSTDFPMYKAILNTPGGGFATQIISAMGVITYGYSTYLDGDGWEIAVDRAGNAYVTGSTSSTNFPIRNAIQSVFGGGASDAFVTQIVNTSGIITYGYSTYVGGSSSESGRGIAADGAGNVYVTGYTSSGDFPMWNATSNIYNGDPYDAFVTQIISASGVITYGYSTYLGANGFDVGTDIAVDDARNINVIGVTTSTNFPAQNAISSNFGGGAGDAFVTQIISVSGVYTYGYSTYLGGSNLDRGAGIAVDSTGIAYVTGDTQSGNFPITQNAISNTLSGSGDAFVTVIAPIAADLSISKSDGVTSTAPGELITYTIVVTNSGPDAVSGAVVTDTFPAAVAGVMWSCVASGDAGCGKPGGSGDISLTVNLSATGAITITASGTVASNATGTLSNTAYVSHPADFSTANNSATDNDVIVWKLYLPLMMK